jgi:hypothetical protein
MIIYLHIIKYAYRYKESNQDVSLLWCLFFKGKLLKLHVKPHICGHISIILK